MPARSAIRAIHLATGVTALLTILAFWSATTISELFGDAAAITAVKRGVLWGMLLLVPAMAAVGGSGFRLGGRSKAPVVAAKRRRMLLIAALGLGVLAPSAFFLSGRAEAGLFDATFYFVQAAELAAGAVNLGLMALNMRDGLRMTRKTPRPESRLGRNRGAFAA